MHDVFENCSYHCHFLKPVHKVLKPHFNSSIWMSINLVGMSVPWANVHTIPNEDRSQLRSLWSSHWGAWSKRWRQQWCHKRHDSKDRNLYSHTLLRCRFLTKADGTLKAQGGDLMPEVHGVHQNVCVTYTLILVSESLLDHQNLLRKKGWDMFKMCMWLKGEVSGQSFRSKDGYWVKALHKPQVGWIVHWGVKQKGQSK